MAISRKGQSQQTSTHVKLQHWTSRQQTYTHGAFQKHHMDQSPHPPTYYVITKVTAVALPSSAQSASAPSESTSMTPKTWM
eukprot:4779091-Amphidinium_carterae.1